jgi:DNA-binding beta-propeller fold protein YncE
MTLLVKNRRLGALALALQIGVVAPFGPASAQGDSQYVGYVMSQTSSTMMVLDTRTNTIMKKVTHPDMVKPAWGRFHPSTKRYYAGGTGKFTVWDTTNLADPIHLKTVVPAPGSTGEYRGFLVYKGSKAAIDGEVWVTNIKDHAVYVYRAADLEQATPLPVKVFGPDHGVRGPHYMQVRPTTNEVWLTNRTATTNGYFLRFDGTTHTVITTPADRLETTSTAGDEPTEFVFSRDGLLAYVGHHGNTITGSPTNSHNIAIVDAAAFAVKKLITTAATQQTPSYVDIDADASRVYFIAKWVPTLAVLDIKTERILRYIELGGFGPGYGVATTPDKKYLYVSMGAPAQSAVVVVDAKTLTVVTNIIDSDLNNPRSVRFTSD